MKKYFNNENDLKIFVECIDNYDNKEKKSSSNNNNNIGGGGGVNNTNTNNSNNIPTVSHINHSIINNKLALNKCKMIFNCIEAFIN